jgi:DNA-binding NarL/FixJ family response regulator
MTIRVVIVDDHKVVRVGLASVLGSTDDIEVVETVGTARDAIESVRSHLPDVLVLDLRLPDQPGTAVIGPVRELSPRTRILVLTSYGEDQAVLASVRAGVDGFLTKTVDSEAFVDAVRGLAAGKQLLRDEVADALLHIVQTMDPAMNSGARAQAALTMREWDVARAVAEGLSNREVAERLHVSERTVKHHVSEILSKLDLARRGQIGRLLRGDLARDDVW